MSKGLAAYFSASGVTAKIKNLSEAIDTDLFEIRPKVPYYKYRKNRAFKLVKKR